MHVDPVFFLLAVRTLSSVFTNTWVCSCSSIDFTSQKAHTDPFRSKTDVGLTWVTVSGWERAMRELSSATAHDKCSHHSKSKTKLWKAQQTKLLKQPKVQRLNRALTLSFTLSSVTYCTWEMQLHGMFFKSWDILCSSAACWHFVDPTWGPELIPTKGHAAFAAVSAVKIMKVFFFK